MAIPRRPITHTYIVKSTDPITGFLSAKGTPMLLPLRHTSRRRATRTMSLVAKDDVRIYMEEVDNG